MLKRSTIQLLRFPFSFFLMPVYWFALSFVENTDKYKAILAFVIIHVLIYPSSNGYNSYMDRDTGSIGGLRNPMLPQKQLFYITIAMDVLAIVLSFLLPAVFTLLLLCYIICSRLYSYRGIRLKKFPVTGYLTVIINQGAVVFLMVYLGANAKDAVSLPWHGMIAACFLMGGAYPITQIYQHETDEKDGVRTLSMLLGKKGTFIFCALMYLVAFAILFQYYRHQDQLWLFGILQVFFIPVIVYFIGWLFIVWKNEALADFEHTMQMNWLASTCTTLAFITIIMVKSIG